MCHIKAQKHLVQGRCLTKKTNKIGMASYIQATSKFCRFAKTINLA